MHAIETNGNVSTDFSVLSSKINAIKSKANSILSSMEENNVSFESTTKVPNCEFKLLNKNLGNISILLNKIIIEADAILSIGESIKNMAIDLTNKTYLLNCDIKDSSYAILKKDNEYVLNPQLSSETEQVLEKYNSIGGKK